MNGEAWDIADAAALVAAIDAELAATTAADAELVRKGRLDGREADYRARLVADIRADLGDQFAPLAEGDTLEEAGRSFWPREGRAVAWANKVRWITAELDDRNRAWPELVKKGRLTQAESDRRIGAIAQLRKLYWEKLFMWEPQPGPALDYLKAIRSAVLSRAPAEKRLELLESEGAQILRDQVRKHMATVELEANGQGRLVA